MKWEHPFGEQREIEDRHEKGNRCEPALTHDLGRPADLAEVDLDPCG
jgi:hypothetical protein